METSVAVPIKFFFFVWLFLAKNKYVWVLYEYLKCPNNIADYMAVAAEFGSATQWWCSSEKAESVSFFFHVITE